MAETISAEKLKEQKDQFVIIDVRESDELAGRQIDGSINIPLGLAIRNARQGKLITSKVRKSLLTVPQVIEETLQLKNFVSVVFKQ